ncbi:nucleotide disphospho-sugar-binding domain-containing protein [Saccharomonospora sp. NPDC006951]
MRLLIVSAPLLGHAFPMVPLARAMRESGHEVLFATGGAALSVADAGLDTADVGSQVRLGRAALGVTLRHPLLAKVEAAGAADLGFVSRLFGAANTRMLADVLAVTARWKPDVIVHEPLATSAAIAAERYGIPAVVHDTSLFDGAALTEATALRMGSTVPAPSTVLRTAPRSVLATEGGWPMRYVPYSGSGPVPDWFASPGPPRVLVSRSTVQGPGGGALMAAVAAAASEVPAEFVLVRPPKALAKKTMPGNVRLVDWIPIPRVLGSCAAIVHHGGAGTLLTALAAGIPQLVEPGAGDRARHARLISARGAGLAAKAAEVTPELLGELVTSEAMTSAAAEVRAEIAAMPPPEAVADRLTDLIASPA